MKNTTKYLFLISISVIAIFTACNTEDVDTVKPVINITSPLDHASFLPGDTIHFEVELSDNVGLKQYKVDIHYGGGHEHKAFAATITPVDWVFDDIIGNIDGINRHVHKDLIVPANVKLGEYHLSVFATDIAGNEAYIVIEIKIQQPV